MRGFYELFFDLKAPRGFQGTEGCRVLSINPPRSLAFEFLAPPQFPNVRRVRTRVDVLFEEVLSGGLVKVSLAHSGFVEGEEWDECFDFFSWCVVDRLEEDGTLTRIAAARAETSATPEPEADIRDVVRSRRPRLAESEIVHYESFEIVTRCRRASS